MAAQIDSSDSFNNLSSKITQFLYGRTKNDRNVIKKTLDDLNSFNYKYNIVANPTKAVLLINQCCSLIPPEDLELVLKCCQLITNLIARQNVVVEGRTLTVAVQWCLHSLKGFQSDTEILVALDALLRSNTKHSLISEIVKNTTITTLATNLKNPEVTLFALQCLEACTCPPEDLKTSTLPNFPIEVQSCFDIFLKHLLRDNAPIDKLANIKIYMICLRGLQNIVIQMPDLLQDNIGLVLGIIKTYMLLGINGCEFLVPQKLMPSALSIPEPTTNMVREKNGGKMTKHRKHRTQPTISKVEKKAKWNDDHRYSSGYSPAAQLNVGPEETNSISNNQLKTSDSDFSDTEAGGALRLAMMAGRVRQTALTFLLWTVKLTHKSVIFSYWSSFIPENPSSNKHTLITCILKDTSTKGRMAALNVLLVLLASSKLYLAQAEKGENLAFTPFSVILGLMIKELHKCLSLALNENSIPVLNMVLKCLAALVQATPYHRLFSGLINKVVRNVKFFVYHKDPTVQVTALIVLGCVLASEPSIPETTEGFIKHVDSAKFKETMQPVSDESFEFAEFSSEEENQEISGKTELPWLLERCLSNLGVETDSEQITENTVCTAVKMESLQIISAMSRNHFEPLLVPHISLVTKALEAALCNKYSDVRLHAGRAVDFMGHAINRCLDNRTEPTTISIDHCLTFWLTLLNGSLTTLLQNEQPVLRAIGCDCLGSIGATIFEELPRDKQILSVTLLFACSRDEDNSVKGAAVRALAICVLHPSLREDLGFVVDTAEAIHRVLQDENFTVRVKCSWSLGNLSDALVLNKANPHLTEELPNSLLFKLLKTTIKASRDSDKIKMNTVRALGNILQLIDADLLEDRDFKAAVEEGIHVLIKNCTGGSNMKVRWNSCCAIGNAMKNHSLFASTIDWQAHVFNALTDLVVNFRNFKVRINAAVALATPSKREFYKNFYQAIFIALIKGLETSQNMEDFSEYKHRDHLIEQICLTLGYLITLLTKDDLPFLKESIFSEHLKLHMQRVWERLLPEKSTPLFDARTCLGKLLSDPSLTSEQRNVLQYLSEILTQAC